MNTPTLIFEGITIYWHGVFMASAVALAVITAFVCCYLYKKDCKDDLINCTLLSIPMAFAFSRLMYYSCNYEEFKTIADFFNFSRGGYAHYGAIIGVLLAAGILKWRNPDFRAGAGLDCLAG